MSASLPTELDAPPIGGFFGLELPPAAAEYHAARAVLTSARACFRYILAETRPKLVHVPFYTCDELVEPLDDLGIAYRFYPIDQRLAPIFDFAALGPGERCVVIDYFGLNAAHVDHLVRRFGETIFVDNTQAFFNRPNPGTLAFNSARKWFGVPDGAYLFGPRRPAAGIRANLDLSVDFLATKLNGDQKAAYVQYQASEERVSSAPIGATALSRRLLSLIDYEDVRRRRRENFRHLHERLGVFNAAPFSLEVDAAAVPFFYPFLPARGVDRADLHARKIYFPKFWQHCIDRPGDGFGWEREVAERLLPLPIDHRYGTAEMDRVVGGVLQALDRRRV